MRGKGAMVWKLRSWKSGDPQAQAAHARELGLSHVSIKIVDGRQERWERSSQANQNADLLPAAVGVLRSAGVEVTAWGWTWGGQYVLSVFRKDVGIARAEGQLAAELCQRYSIGEFLIDAEGEYNRTGMASVAEAYMLGFEGVAPTVRHLLCSYRFPKTYQQSFPVEAFATYQEGWAPQVYFVGDNRVDGGAIQMERSKAQYDTIRPLPFFPVAPTYRAAFAGGAWQATGEQLMRFFARAAEIGCEGVSVWDLPQADEDQLLAIKNFQWPGAVPPPPVEVLEVGVTVPAGKARVTVTEV